MDPLDPRAPSEDVWSAMTDEQRAAVIEALPSQIETQPEADEHRDAKGETHALPFGASSSESAGGST